MSRRLSKNIISLYGVQGLNYALPLITVPFLLRVLHADKYGLIIFSQVTIGYLQVLTEYGFNYTAVTDLL
jgi:polysaccharide transporter, PST family